MSGERAYRIQEGRFELSAGLRDDSVNIFTGEGPDFDHTSLVINRMENAAVDDLHAYVLGQIEGFQKSLPHYAWHRGARITVAGQPGFEIEFTWQSKDGNLHQWQLYVPANDHDKILVITFTARDVITDGHRQAVAHLLETFRPG